FFSSRRRHTRFSRDWSSDVCSSDLDSLIKRIFRPSRFARVFLVEIRVHHLFGGGAGSFAFAGLIFVAGGLGLFGLRALAFRLLLAAFFLAILAFGLVLVCLALVALVVVGKFFAQFDRA